MDNPFEKTVAVSLRFHGWGIRRGVRKNEVRIISSQSQEEVSKEALALNKRLLESDEYKAIGAGDTKLKAYVESVSVPSLLREGTYLVPFEAVERVDEKIKDYVENVRPELVRAFLDVYPEKIESARERLGPLFNSRQYPAVSALRDAFSVEYRWETFGPPKELGDLNPEIYRQAREKIERDMREAAEEIRDAARTALVELVSRLQRSLSEKRPDGKPIKLYDSAVGNLEAWLENFELRNVTNDAELAAAVSRCRDMLRDIDIQEARKDIKVREEMATGVKEVCETLSGLVVVKARKLSFDEEA